MSTVAIGLGFLLFLTGWMIWYFTGSLGAMAALLFGIFIMSGGTYL